MVQIERIKVRVKSPSLFQPAKSKGEAEASRYEKITNVAARSPGMDAAPISCYIGILCLT